MLRHVRIEAGAEDPEAPLDEERESTRRATPAPPRAGRRAPARRDRRPRPIRKARQASVRAPIATNDAVPLRAGEPCPTPPRSAPRARRRARARTTDAARRARTPPGRRGTRRRARPGTTQYVASIAGELSLRDSMGACPQGPLKREPRSGSSSQRTTRPPISSRSSPRCASTSASHGGSSSSMTPRPTVPGRSPSGSRRRTRTSRCFTGRARRVSAPPTSRGFARRWRAAQSSSSRWTPTSPTIPPTCRACSPARRDADLVLGSRYVPGGGVEDWGPLRRVDQPRRLRLRPGECSGVDVQRPHGGLQGVAPRGARGDRPGFDIRLRLRVPGGNHLPRDSRRVSSGRAADRLPRPTRGSVQDDQGHRARGGVARARHAASRVPWRRAQPLPSARSTRTSTACCRRS